jgi:hypothetical protein
MGRTLHELHLPNGGWLVSYSKFYPRRLIFILASGLR